MANKKIIFLGIGVAVIVAIIIFLIWFIPNYRRHKIVQEKYGPMSEEEEGAAEEYEKIKENPKVTPEQKEATIKEIEEIAHSLNFGTNDVGEPVLPANEIFVGSEVWDETKYNVTFEIYADKQADLSEVKKEAYQIIGKIMKTFYTSDQPIGRVVISVTRKQEGFMVRDELLLVVLTLADAEKAKIDWNQSEATLFYETLPNAWETIKADSDFANAQIE